MHPKVHSSIIYNCQDMEVTQVSINRWMNKEDVVYTYNGILLSHKKEWNFAICSNMDATRDYYTKWSKSERERQIPYDITYMWNLKYGTNEPIYKAEIHRDREQICGFQGLGGRERGGLGVWDW